MILHPLELRFLAQEPYFQAHRPFVNGRPWTELGLDRSLAKVLTERTGTRTAYLHREDWLLVDQAATKLR